MKKIQKIKHEKMVSVSSKWKSLSEMWRLNTVLETHHEQVGRFMASWYWFPKILSNQLLIHLENSI